MRSSKSLQRRLADWLTWHLGPRLSRIGELSRQDWLTYNPLTFRTFHELAVRNAPGVASSLVQVFPTAVRFLDVGAGSGAYAAQLQRMGKQVVACEHSPIGRRMGLKQGVDVRSFDLGKSPPTDVSQSFDLAYCFEVAEHLPPLFGERLVHFLVGCAPTIVFSAAQPGQGGFGHINEQPAAHWIALFAKHGMRHDLGTSGELSGAFAAASVSPWFEQNALVFRA